jgi:hypothetical protein
MLGSHALDKEDWALVAVMEANYSPAAIGAELAAWSPSRCEALLHAWPEDPREELANAGWAEEFLARWDLIEATMAGLEPTTWSRDQVEEVAVAAGKAA